MESGRFGKNALVLFHTAGGTGQLVARLHPLDLLVGLCCGAGLRLAVYLKSKNAKKIPAWHGVWFCPLEVHNFKCKGSLYGRTGGYAHD